MDLALTQEQSAIRSVVRDFVDKHLVPLEAEFLLAQREGREGLPKESMNELRDRARVLGFWGLATPEQLGGMGVGELIQSIIHTELARTCIPFSFGGDADNVLFDGTEQQRAAYLLPTISGERISCFALTEPGAGSDAAGIRTRARRDGSDWVISGEKTFITKGNDADFAIVIAVTDPESGARHGSTAFLVDRSMGWTSHPIPVMGWDTPATLHFDNVRVPDSHVLGEVGKGFDVAMKWIGRGRFVIPSQALGIAERCLSMSIDYANMRETFGHPIADNQAIQWMIADSEVELESARWLALRAAWLQEQGADARHATSIAKLAGAGMVNRVVDRALQIHGGMGYARELPLEYWYRAVRVFRIFEGSDEMQRLIVARDLLRGRRRIGLY